MYDCLEYEDVYGWAPVIAPAWDGAAYSQARLTDNGSFAVRVSSASAGVVVGLTAEPSGHGYLTITHGLLFQNGTVQVIESGATKTEPVTFSATDTFHFYRLNGVVYYLKQTAGAEYGGLPGDTILMSGIPLFGPVYLDTSMYAAGDRILSAELVDYGQAVVPLTLEVFATEPVGYSSGEARMILGVVGIEADSGRLSARLVLDAFGFESEGGQGLVDMRLGASGTEEIQPKLSTANVGLVLSAFGAEIIDKVTSCEAGLKMSVWSYEATPIEQCVAPIVLGALGAPETTCYAGLMLSAYGHEASVWEQCVASLVLGGSSGIETDCDAGLILSAYGYEVAPIEQCVAPLHMSAASMGLITSPTNLIRIILRLSDDQSLSEFAPIKLFPGYRREAGRVIIPLADIQGLSAADADNETGNYAEIMRALLIHFHEYCVALPLNQEIATVNTWVLTSATVAPKHKQDLKSIKTTRTSTRTSFVIDFDTETPL